MAERFVACKDCRNYLGRMTYRYRGNSYEMKHSCRITHTLTDPIAGKINVPSDAEVLNGQNDCPHFTPKGGERVRPTVPPKPSCWTRFVGWLKGAA